MVIQLPPGPYIGLVDDHHQRWVLDMGIPGPDQGPGGQHLVLPPGYDSDLPDGYQVGRAGSLKGLLAVRALPVGGDLPKALEPAAEVGRNQLLVAAFAGSRDDARQYVLVGDGLRLGNSLTGPNR